jgi:hypothetical protein
MVMEVWQASLMRAFAQQVQRERNAEEEEREEEEDDVWDDSDEGSQDEEMVSVANGGAGDNEGDPSRDL